MSDETYAQLESLIFASVEELIVLRIHLENEELDEAAEKLAQTQINLNAITELAFKEEEGGEA